MSEKLRRILMGILAVVFLVSAGIFIKSMLEYRKGDAIYENALGFVVETDAPQEIEKELPPGMRTYENIDFAGMRAVNEDVIGWIQIYDTPVDYPLLDADDNKHYLNRTYDGQWSGYGSIFIEPRNNSDLNDRHLVIYGHNMINDSMFGSLPEYKNQAYYDAHDKIRVCMPDKDMEYQIFSAYTAHVDSATYYMSFTDDAQFKEMIDHMKVNSVIQSDIMPDTDDQILTLSTCTPAGAKKYRFVVNAVLVEDNEVSSTE